MDGDPRCDGKIFQNQQILGWALSLPGYGEDLNEQIIRAHLNHFGGNDKTLFRVNGQEKEETFYTYEGGTAEHGRLLHLL